MSEERLPAATSIGTIKLRVAELERSLGFYRDLLGLTELQRSGDTVALGARGHAPLLELWAAPGTHRRPDGMVGLYHFALLLPTRRELGMTLLRLFQERWPFTGFADHGVSEAAYLSDPDNNGIELYADRPREDWPRHNGELAMTTLNLNVNSLIRSAEGEEWNGLHPRTTVGHLHLHVSDLAKAEEFWGGVIGFDVTSRNYPGALFLSAGGYHHHLGLNTWLKTRGVDPQAAGLAGFELKVPDDAARNAIAERALAAGLSITAAADQLVVVEPNGMPVQISAGVTH